MNTEKRYPEEFKVIVCEEYEGGATYKFLANKHKVSQATIFYWVDTKGYERRSNKIKVDEEEMVRMYANDCLKEEIQKKFRVSKSVIERIFTERGIKNRSRLEHNRLVGKKKVLARLKKEVAIEMILDESA